jgi:hypothetical protein
MHKIKNKAAHWRDHLTRDISLKRVIHPMETLGEIHFQCSLSDGGMTSTPGGCKSRT